MLALIIFRLKAIIEYKEVSQLITPANVSLAR